MFHQNLWAVTRQIMFWGFLLPKVETGETPTLLGYNNLNRFPKTLRWTAPLSMQPRGQVDATLEGSFHRLVMAPTMYIIIKLPNRSHHHECQLPVVIEVLFNERNGILFAPH